MSATPRSSRRAECTLPCLPTSRSSRPRWSGSSTSTGSSSRTSPRLREPAATMLPEAFRHRAALHPGRPRNRRARCKKCLLPADCRHRGTTVCRYEHGNAEFFRCPYHGWTYSNRGPLIGVPFPSRYDSDFDKGDIGLVPVPRLDHYRGFYFASLAEDGPSLIEHLGRSAGYIDMFTAGVAHGEDRAERRRLEVELPRQLEIRRDGRLPRQLHSQDGPGPAGAPDRERRSPQEQHRPRTQPHGRPRRRALSARLVGDRPGARS